jgi:hypothetical protein
MLAALPLLPGGWPCSGSTSCGAASALLLLLLLLLPPLAAACAAAWQLLPLPTASELVSAAGISLRCLCGDC